MGFSLRLPASQAVGSDLAASASSVSSDPTGTCILHVCHSLSLNSLHSHLLYLQPGEISHGAFSASTGPHIAGCSGMLARTGCAARGMGRKQAFVSPCLLCLGISVW